MLICSMQSGTRTITRNVTSILIFVYSVTTRTLQHNSYTSALPFTYPVLIKLMNFKYWQYPYLPS